MDAPTPEAYTVHKMVINDQRGEKAEKDANAVLGLWLYLSASEQAASSRDKRRRNVRAPGDSWMNIGSKRAKASRVRSIV